MTSGSLMQPTRIGFCHSIRESFKVWVLGPRQQIHQTVVFCEPQKTVGLPRQRSMRVLRCPRGGTAIIVCADTNFQRLDKVLVALFGRNVTPLWYRGLREPICTLRPRFDVGYLAPYRLKSEEGRDIAGSAWHRSAGPGDGAWLAFISRRGCGEDGRSSHR